MFFVLLLLSLLAGCASSPITLVDSKSSEVIDYPDIAEETTKGLGERLVAKGKRVTGKAIEISEATQFNKKEGESSVMTCAFTVPESTVFKRGIYSRDNITADCYGPVNYMLTQSDGTTDWNCPGRMGVGDICQKEDGSFFLATMGTFRFDLKQDFDNLEVIEKVVERKNNFVQEIIYNGRVKNSLKFVYREFSDNMIRPAFTQDVQYDLSESAIVGFKTLRMEIIKANNTSITYKLINNF